MSLKADPLDDPQFLDAVSHLSSQDAVDVLQRERAKRMSFKDDPLQQHHTPGGRTLFLNRDNMLEARENWWKAFNDIKHDTITSGEGTDRRTWDICWAASIAAYSYLMEGRTEPK